METPITGRGVIHPDFFSPFYLKMNAPHLSSAAPEQSSWMRRKRKEEEEEEEEEGEEKEENSDELITVCSSEPASERGGGLMQYNRHKLRRGRGERKIRQRIASHHPKRQPKKKTSFTPNTLRNCAGGRCTQRNARRLDDHQRRAGVGGKNAAFLT